jgi:hypothetical protein
MKLNVFYHIFLSEDANKLIEEQLQKLYSSGIYEHSTIYIYINDIYGGKYTISEENTILMNKISNNINYYTNHYYEIYTQAKLYELSKKEDACYLYMHTKGVTRINHKDEGKYSYRNVKNWRNIMEHFCIDHWQECIKQLETNDLVGCNYFPKNSLPGVPAHYSGGFWWSKSSFINRLPDPNRYLIGNIDRFHAEFWIGRIQHTAMCLYPIPHPIPENHNRCFIYTDESEYINKIQHNQYIN